jgi:3D (Asp-Asp-Asp) domain-containing protein
LMFALGLSCLMTLYGTVTLNDTLYNKQLTLQLSPTIKTDYYEHGKELTLSTQQDNRPLRTPESVGRNVLTSCYTSQESHGANGRNEWSVATYLYPQGTHLFIEGIGEKVVETVTSRKYSERLDIWFGEDWDGCKEYGLQNRKVWVL